MIIHKKKFWQGETGFFYICSQYDSFKSFNHIPRCCTHCTVRSGYSKQPTKLVYKQLSLF